VVHNGEHALRCWTPTRRTPTQPVRDNRTNLIEAVAKRNLQPATLISHTWGSTTISGLGAAMTNAELYRARAKDAEAKAERAPDEYVKEAYLKIARDYQLLAEQAEPQGGRLS
jgi:hypothetical protein